MHTIAQDLRYALRQLRKSPGFTATALLTLAIGIGANAAIFSLLHAVLLKSLPVADPRGLYKFGDEYNCCIQGSFQDNWSMFSYPFYQAVRDTNSAFTALAAAATSRPDLSVRRPGSNVSESLRGEQVSGNYFSTLGLNAFAGRMITPADDQPNAAPVAVMSFRTWQQKYGLDTSLIGSSVTVNGIPVTLIGVAPPGFFGDRLESDPPDIWLPLSVEPLLRRENSLLHDPKVAWLYVVGRLRPGLQPSTVQAQLTAELRQYLRNPANHDFNNDDSKKVDSQKLVLAPGGSGINSLKDDYEQGLYLLMGVSAAVLIIACANLANLLLARSAATRVRTALQLAIGASRQRVIRQLLTESVLIAFLGGIGGLAVALYATKAILLIAFRGSPNVPISASPSLPVLLFTFTVALLTGIGFGVGPAWIASRSDPAESLRGASRSIKDSSAVAQKSLIVVQAALSLALLTIAVLLTQSLRNLQNQQYGFERQGRLIVQFDPLSAGYTQERLAAMYQRLEDRLARIPGVISESLSLYTAQQGNNWGEGVFIPGRTESASSSWDRVSAHYFETIGTPILQGRGFRDEDTAAAQRVAVVNEAFVRKFFPNDNPIGKHFGKDERSHAGDYEIIGVAKDAKYQEASRPPRAMFFVPLAQRINYTDEGANRVEDGSMYMSSIELHVSGDPYSFAPVVRGALAEIDPNLSPISSRTFEEEIGIQNSEHTLISRLSAAFGAIALLLACVGLYGVTAYRVARRTSEVGLRMALGANRSNILALILRGAFVQVAIGLLLGVPLVFALKRWLQHQLFGVGALNPVALLAAILTLVLCAFVASVLPATRAASIEPMQALRTE